MNDVELNDETHDLAWRLARAYCPRPGQEPCGLCFDETADQLLLANATTGLPEADVAALCEVLKDGTLDNLLIAKAIRKGILAAKEAP